MKKYIIFLLIMGFILVGCNQKMDQEKGEIDIKGVITEVDHEGNRILVDDNDHGLIWITLHENGEIKDYEIGQKVAVWIDGSIMESFPAQAKALNIEHIPPDK